MRSLRLRLVPTRGSNYAWRGCVSDSTLKREARELVFPLAYPITLGLFLMLHEMSNSPYRANLLLPRLPWKRHQQEQG